LSDAARQRGSPEENRRTTREERLEGLLEAAAGLMAKQGFSQTTIRDVARETGFSLAGMYHYFESKEDLLFQIQHGTFSRLLAEQEVRVTETDDPEQRLRSLIATHLTFFQHHAGEMKVCTYELESLTGDAYEAIEDLRRRYYRLTAGIVADLVDAVDPGAKTQARVRHLALFTFGALNWVFMWYQPKKDVPIAQLADEMSEFVLGGIKVRSEQNP
jgi:AcrR family transcriptional regulator